LEVPVADMDAELSLFLQPFIDRFGHKKRGAMCPLYIAGLLGPGDRKSIEPMATRLAPGQYDRLHHFISDGMWDDEPLRLELAHQADRMVGADDAFLVIDDTALPKKGEHSVGVAPQYASMLGKRANCQTLVSLTLARAEVPVPLALRLFLPESWTNAPSRMLKAGIPEQMRQPRTKPEIALEEIDRLMSTGMRFGVVLADAGYGLSAAFRQGLSARGLVWAVGIPKHQKVYPHDVSMIFPVSGRGRPRQHPIPDILSAAAETILADAGWRKVSWRRGTKGRLSARFAARASSTCPAKRPGSSVNGVQTANANIISPICLPIRRSNDWPAPSRRVGSASRRTSR
jgi:SRSO17 transposase